MSRTTHLVGELDRLCREAGTDDPACPVCGGTVEITTSHAITCTTHGSDHYRWELPEENDR